MEWSPFCSTLAVCFLKVHGALAAILASRDAPRAATFAANGNLSSSVETMQDGLTLNIGSQFIDKDRVKLAIDASLEDFTTPARRRTRLTMASW